jgi:hypothetical protein
MAQPPNTRNILRLGREDRIFIRAFLMPQKGEVFACTWYSASRLPEVRGRAGARAASASYASYRSDSIYTWEGTRLDVLGSIFRNERPQATPKRRMRGACKKSLWRRCECFTANPTNGGSLGGGGLHRSRPALGARPRPAWHKTRSVWVAMIFGGGCVCGYL